MLISHSSGGWVVPRSRHQQIWGLVRTRCLVHGPRATFSLSPRRAKKEETNTIKGLQPHDLITSKRSILQGLGPSLCEFGGRGHKRAACNNSWLLGLGRNHGPWPRGWPSCSNQEESSTAVCYVLNLPLDSTPTTVSIFRQNIFSGYYCELFS